MTTSTHLVRSRRFLPLFVTQLLGAFNDNLFKNAMVLFVVYSVYNSEEAEAKFSAIATALVVIPFVALSALSGQLADLRDKAKIIRIVKFAEILIMLVGAAGLLMAWKGMAVTQIAIPLMMAALFGMGVHSTFFGPIKYAILPQHLKSEEVLSGTGLVEAGTYIAILAGTILAGWIDAATAATVCLGVALVGYLSGRQVPPAPPMHDPEPLDFNLWRASVNLVRNTMHDRRVFLAIMAISFFWTIGSVLFIQFPPLAKNVLHASKQVASLFLVIFSVGVAIGSVAISAMLRGKVSARFAPASVIGMGMFVTLFFLVCQVWTDGGANTLNDTSDFIGQRYAIPLMLTLLGIAICGGMFVVPLYAFLTTFVDKSQTARTIAANNIVNSFAMVIGAAISMGLAAIGLRIQEQLLLSAAMCVVSAWLGYLLYRAEEQAKAA